MNQWTTPLRAVKPLRFPFRLGSRGSASTIDGARIDRRDGPACFQPVRNQQPVGGCDDAGHLFSGLRTKDLFQEGVQSAQALRAVIDPQRPDLTTFFIKDQGVMMLITQTW